MKAINLLKQFCNSLFFLLNIDFPPASVSPKYWSFSVSPSNEYSGLISFRMTGLICLLSKGLLRIFSRTVVQKHQFFGTQPFFMVQPSHPYMTTGKTIALAIWTFRYLLADQCPFILCRYLLSHCFGLPGNSLCLHNL